jgi:chorismate-pyruvate lyase
MNAPFRIAKPDLHTLLALFPNVDLLAAYQWVLPLEVPPPYDRLLVHEHHMTVTVEAHHGAPVNVRILNRRQDGEVYARKILLTLTGSERVVQFGIMRVNLQFCSPVVRAEIIAGQTPLGRILINHDVMRRIEPTAFLRIETGPALMSHFQLEQPTTTYGRLAILHCDERPAIEVLEIVTPE